MPAKPRNAAVGPRYEVVSMRASETELKQIDALRGNRSRSDILRVAVDLLLDTRGNNVVAKKLSPGGIW